jgi:ABC-type transport system substrate-binding protein
MGGLYTLGYIYEYLFYADSMGGELLPVIGKSYTVSDDYTTVDVEMFDYVKDSAGNAITASDVVFSYETAFATGNYSSTQRYVENVEKTGDYSVRFTLKDANLATVENVIGNGIYIVSENAYNEEKYATEPIGTGAYIVDSFISGSSLELSKNENYWQTDSEYIHPNSVANVEHITCKIILESAQVAIALENGDIDIATSTSSEDVQNYFADNADYTVSSHLSNRYQVLVFSMQNSNVCDDLKLRQAILYAINNDEVMYGVVGTNGEVCRTIGMDSGFEDFNQDWYNEDYYDFNLDKAQQLIDESDYEANGSPTLRIIFENNSDKQRIAELIQGMLLEIGVKTSITAYDSALFTTYKYEYDEWDILIDNFAVTSAPLGTHWSGLVFNAGLDTDTPYSLNTGHTDETLNELATLASGVTTWSKENVNNAHEYLKDNAYQYGLYTAVEFNVAQSGITEIGLDKRNFINVSKSVYADDYVSVG